MKRALLILISFTLALTALTSYASVTLDYCIKKAEENYPAIKQYSLIDLTEKYTLNALATQWAPQLNFSAQATWQTDVASFPDELKNILKALGRDMDGMRKDQYRLQLELYQNIWDGGGYSANKKIEKSKSTQSRYKTDVEMYQVEERVINVYFATLLFDKQIQQMNSTIELLESNLNTMRSMVSRGVALQSDADAIEAQMLTTTQRRDQLTSGLKSQKTIMSLFIGADVTSEDFDTPEDIETPLTDEPERPELYLLDASAALIDAQRKSVNSMATPRIGAFAQGWYGYPGLNMFENMMNANWSLNAIVGVKLQWNISAFYSHRSRLKNLDVSKSQIEVQKETFKFNNKMQTSGQREEIERLTTAVEYDSRITELRKSIRTTAESKLKNGTINTLELLQYITDENMSLSAKSLHETELLKAKYQIYHTLGLTYKEYSEK